MCNFIEPCNYVGSDAIPRAGNDGDVVIAVVIPVLLVLVAAATAAAVAAIVAIYFKRKRVKSHTCEIPMTEG